jgi:hypothetical protein
MSPCHFSDLPRFPLDVCFQGVDRESDVEAVRVAFDRTGHQGHANLGCSVIEPGDTVRTWRSIPSVQGGGYMDRLVLREIDSGKTK